MTDRPILFFAPMVRALLAGTKTQTRRIMPDQSLLRDGPDGYEIWTGFMGWQSIEWALANRGACGKGVLPRIAAGDRLWVRETWSGEHEFRDVKPSERESFAAEGMPYFRESVWFWADGNPDFGDWERPRPGIHMPRWASRLTLLVTDVRVERLQDISENDAVAEGMRRLDGPLVTFGAGAEAPYAPSPRTAYAILWNNINGAGAWDVNPWIVAYSFRCIPKNIDSLTGAE